MIPTHIRTKKNPTKRKNYSNSSNSHHTINKKKNGKLSDNPSLVCLDMSMDDMELLLQNAAASSSLMAMTSATELSSAVEGARGEFFLWFFGASGGAGIARSQFPKMYDNVKAISALKGEGPTLGGETVGLNVLCGYPEDISLADYQKIVNNPKSLSQLAKEGPKDGSFLVQRGYLTYDAFVAGNKGCNPLAMRAVFDTFATSTNVVSPIEAQKMMDDFKEDSSGEKFKNALLVSKLQSFSAIAFLLFLLGLADIIAFDAASRGWFPDWPGRGHLPEALFNPGLLSIRDYWL